MPTTSPRAKRQITVALLTAVLGFAAVSSVQSVDAEAGFAGARESDLVQLLDDLTQRRERLEQETRELVTARNDLLSGSAEEVIAQTQERARALAVLAGTAPVFGPGVRITVRDAAGGIGAEIFIDLVQELRDAGAEALAINDRRIVASTWFADAKGSGIVVDGVRIRSPYRLQAIGDGATMSTALQIPGGVSDAVRTAGGSVNIEVVDDVSITAVVPATLPRYAAATS